MADVVVVGAGVGGLSAAILLAARGLSVDVLEAGERPGGKVGIATVDGVEVDTGPSVLTLPDALDGVLRVAGTSLRDEISLFSPEPAFRYLYPDGAAFDVFPDPARTLESAQASLGRGAADELAGFLDYARRIWDAAAPHFVYGDAPSVGALLRAGAASPGLVARIDPLRTMWGAIRSRVRDERVRWLLARYATYNGSDVRRAPATLNCIAHVELALGGYGVRGGMYEVARALVRAAERVGVRVHPGARVARIVAIGGRVAGVETEDGRRWRADAVVGNADAAHVLGDLLPVDSRRRTNGAAASMSGWVGILKARRRVGDEARVAHTVVFPRRYLDEFADVFDRARPPAEPTVYLCAQEAAHARAGWPGHEPVFAMANAPPEPAGGRSPGAVWEGLRATVLARMEAAGLKDADDALVWERTPSGLAAHFPGSRGSIYGAASNSAFAAFRRPPNRVPGVRGLYLATGSAHPGGGVPLCLLSGRAAARALLGDLGLGSV
ncbi:MAG TPA: phytoene desaturase family protein [Longimicrobium sp.]|nr:phytoene desaturase family protein [Longimicrobium sp.]